SKKFPNTATNAVPNVLKTQRISQVSNGILRARGILPAQQMKQDKHLEDKTLDKLDELENEEDGCVLLEYRQKRIAEMKAEALRAKFGEVIQISKPDFIKEAIDASKEVWVVVHLFKYS
ncbi:2473_t:CDS:2, partial [Gigaspora margarita]